MIADYLIIDILVEHLQLVYWYYRQNSLIALTPSILGLVDIY
jgi:hypothetical protein